MSVDHRPDLRPGAVELAVNRSLARRDVSLPQTWPCTVEIDLADVVEVGVAQSCLGTATTAAHVHLVVPGTRALTCPVEPSSKPMTREAIATCSLSS